MQPNDPYQPTQNDQTQAPPPQVFVGEPQVVQPQQSVPVEQPVVAPQPVDVPAPAASVPVPDQTGRSNSVKGVVVGVVALALVAAGYMANSGLSGLARSNAQSAGKAMVAALVAGDANKAYGLASADLKHHETSSALLSSVGDVQTSKASYSDENIQVNGNSAVYVASVDNLPTDDSGQTSGVFVVSLTKHGLNSWKVDDVSIQ